MKTVVKIRIALLALVLACLATSVSGAEAQRRRPGGSSSDRAATLERQLAVGATLYQGICAACHQPDGGGRPGLFPPLAGSDFLARDPARIVAIVLGGLAEPIIVNGEEYNGAMPPLDRLTDDEIADVTTFVLNNWGNPGGRVTPADVGAHRDAR